MKNNLVSKCSACPSIEGALSKVPAATCNGGWYQPYAIKNFYSTKDVNNDKFFKCFKGQCRAGISEGDKLYGNYTIKSHCGEGAGGFLCSTCNAHYFKRGKDCYECPSLPWNIVFYILGPMLALGYFPFMRQIIMRVSPAMFVINAYLQICNQFSGFAIAWPTSIKTVLGVMGLANFDVNLMLFACWWGPSHFMNWIIPSKYTAISHSCT